MSGPATPRTLREPGSAGRARRAPEEGRGHGRGQPGVDQVSTSVLGLARYRFVPTLRQRRGGFLTVALLVGLVGGLALGSLGVARRTQSAYPDFLASSRASDLRVNAYVDAGQSAVANLYDPAFAARLARLPHVRGVAASLSGFVVPVVRGRPQLLAVLQSEVDVDVPARGEFSAQDGLVVSRGRLPDPRRPGEFVATADAASAMHLHVGERLELGAFSFRQVDANALRTPAVVFPGQLVGIVTTADTVVHDAVDQYPAFLDFGPALTSVLLRHQAAGFAYYGVRVAPGTTAKVEDEIIDSLPSRTLYSFRLTAVQEGDVQRAILPGTIALGVFGGIAALAALVIAGLAVARSLWAYGRDVEALRSMGAGPVALVVDAAAGVLVAVVAGAVLAGAVGLALSPLGPVGAVRAVEPRAGLHADWLVLGGGVALFVVGLGLATLGMAALVVRRHASGRVKALSSSPSRLAAAATRMGLPVASVAGIRLAVARGQGRDAVPVGSVMVGAMVAVTVVVATVTFGSGLETLVSHPALYGWNWSGAITEVGGGNIPPLARRLLDEDHDVAAWTGYDYGNISVDGHLVPALLGSVHPALGPPILSGHTLAGDHQIVLGQSTLDDLHKHVGDIVDVSYGSPQDAPVYLPPVPVRIVGTATLPAIGNAGTLHPSMGTGALAPEALATPGIRAAQTSPDPNQNGPAIVVVRMRPDLAPAAALASLRAVAATTTRDLADDPNVDGPFRVVAVQQPAEIGNYRSMGDVPTLLAAGLAAGAVAALALALLATVQRRRRDLAFLKTLGFVRHQLAAVVAWQASLAALAGVVVGVPAGIVVGKVLWDTFARAIAAVPRPSVPVAEVVLVAALALVVANLVALVPGRLAARTSTAALLRTE